MKWLEIVSEDVVVAGERTLVLGRRHFTIGWSKRKKASIDSKDVEKRKGRASGVEEEGPRK